MNAGERLRDLLNGTTEIKPYAQGETVYLYCGKAGKRVAHTVMVRPNSHMTEDLPPGQQYAMCSTYGCMSRPKPPVRQRVTHQQLQEAAVAALPDLLDALEAAERKIAAVEELVSAAEYAASTSLSRTFDGGAFAARVDADRLRAAPAAEDTAELPPRTHRNGPRSDSGPGTGRRDHRDDEGRSGARDGGSDV